MDKITEGQMQEFWRQAKEGHIQRGYFQEFLDHRLTTERSFDLSEWQAFYQKHFNQEYDFSNIVIPEKPDKGRWRLLIITDITLETLYAKCKELFSSWRWTSDNLDKVVDWNERDAQKSAYAIWVRDEIEADEDLKNLSANNVKKKGITTETLAERLIHELKFHDETGKHLDIKNVTLCTGSRYSDGSVPDVRWRCGRLGVYGYHPARADSRLRSRLAVS